jgi:uncharacterized membrane protein YidH (DUF202 family)
VGDKPVASHDPEAEGLPSGLAEERTDLAWNRTGLSALVCVAVLLRRLWPLDRGGQVLAMGFVALAAVIWVIAVTRGRSIGGLGRSATGNLTRRSLRLIATATFLFAVAGFVLGLFPSP